jgi:hypothetical protein
MNQLSSVGSHTILLHIVCQGGKEGKRFLLIEIFQTLWSVSIQKGCEKMKQLDYIPLFVCLVLTVLSYTVSPELPQVQQPEEADQDTVLKLVTIRENVLGIDRFAQ